jgi:hypothetical protein
MSKTTKQLDPLYHNVSNGRTEFRIDSENLKYSDMRLLNVLFLDENGDDLTSNSNGGIYEFIKSITLLSGNIQIDRCDSTDLLSCHRANSVSNRYNTYLQEELIKNKYSFYDECKDLLGNVVIKPNNTDSIFPNMEGYLALSDYLLFLRSTPLFNLPNLRIVIEWSALAKSSVSNSTPVLVYEEAVGDNQPPFMGVVYNSWELDRFTIPAVVNGTPQSVKYRIQGFNNKRVNRFLLAWTPANVSTPNNAKLCSPAQKLEEFNLYWNNIAMFPQDINDSLKSRILLDTWGNKTQPFGQDLYSVEHYNGNIVQANVGLGDHNQSWGGVDMQSLPISNLQLSYKRVGYVEDGQSDTGTDSLTVYVFGEVVKQVSMNDKGQPVVAYL